MTVAELIANLQASADWNKEVLIDVGGVKYVIEDRLIGYAHHVDIITKKRYTGNDFFNFDNPFNSAEEK